MLLGRSIGTGRTQSNVMIKTSRCREHIAASIAIMLLSAGVPARAAGCSFEPQGEGRVTAVIDARTFLLDDGREVRLAGIVQGIAARIRDGTAANARAAESAARRIPLAQAAWSFAHKAGAR